MKNFNLLICTLLFISFLTSCVDREFDLPPIPEPADLETNASIADLKALYVPGSNVLIAEDFTIDVQVAANDRTANYFRRIIVQDETGGIEVLINTTGLYTDFPVGSKVFIKTKGLYIGDNQNNIQIGGTFNEDGHLLGIELLLLDEFLFKGTRFGSVEPKIKTIDELGPADESTLITLENVEFADNALGQSLATPGGTSGKNLTLRDCDGNTMILRTSDFADFAGLTTPCGNGSITGIYSVYQDDNQLFIREIEEVQLTENRCDGSEPCSGEDGEQIDISEVRALYTGATTTAPAGRFIKGIVISDRVNSNLPSKNVVIQQPNDKGILVRFDDNSNFNLNDQITIDISGLEISEWEGLLQLNNVPNFRAKADGSGTITPQVLTINQLLADFENLESTLVKISDVTVSGNATFAVTNTISDATGSMDLYTTNYASFANDPIPDNEVDVIAIVTQGGPNSSRRLSIRNLTDLDGYEGGGGGDPDKMSIAAVRNLFSGSNTSVPADRFIEGVVISDRANENITERNLVIQEPGGKGIVIRFATTNTINLNSTIKVNVGGMELSEFNGLLQINNVPNANATVTGTGSITPNVLTIAQILSDFENLESTLVKIQDVNLTKDSGTIYAFTTIMNDGTGTMDLFTTNYSSFANQNIPNTTVNITGIVSQGGNQSARQLSIRNPGLDIE